MLSYYGERDHARLQMTRGSRRERERRKNTRPRDYGRTLFLLREEKPKDVRVRRRRSGLQQKRSDMSLQRTLRELYRVCRHASHLDSERSLRAGKR